MPADSARSDETYPETAFVILPWSRCVSDGLPPGTAVPSNADSPLRDGCLTSKPLWQPVILVEDTDWDENHSGGAEPPCPHCRVPWTVNRNDDSRALGWTNVVPFSGNVEGLLCSCCRQPRSDIHLLLGLLKACENYVTLQTVRLLTAAPPTNAPVRPDNPHTMACMIVTMSFPYLQQGSPGSRSLLAAPAPRVNKPLSPAMQLLLTLVQSNWDCLSTAMERLQTEALQGVEYSQESFFPDTMSLPELYRRIQGSAFRSNSILRSPPPRTMPSIVPSQGVSEPTALLLHKLPRDILTDRVAPFLRAKSLEALRCTCKMLHETLQAVVPGLKLRLYSHQVHSLAWMRRRECRALLERDCLRHASIGSESEDDDLHRAATGGWTALLRSKDGQSRIRVDQNTGHEVREDDLTGLPRSLARGGLLCDDPGLGKSITLLGLILQTNGLKTAGADWHPCSLGETCSQGDEESDIFEMYWSDNVAPEFQRILLRRLFNSLLRQARVFGTYPVERARFIMRQIENDAYSASFRNFEDKIREDLVHFQFHEGETELTPVLRALACLLDAVKDEQLRSAKKSFASTATRPNSRVAAIIEKQNQADLMSAMVHTSATLLVVPSVLLGHWKAQIETHLDPKYMTEPRKEPLIFLFHQKASKHELTMDRVLHLINVSKSHFPFVFIDMATTRPLPDPNFLAMFTIVITSNQRFRNEWTNGSFQKELQRMTARESDRQFSFDNEEESACPILKIHWLRLVVDEGHSMAQDKQSSTIQFASWVSAERRWAMTGTPTKHNSIQMGQLKNLMSFLQHEFFTPRLDGDRYWQRGIARLWVDRSLASFFRLMDLLSLLMKRHTKLDIAELPTPVYRKAVVPMSSVEVSTYNTLVCAIQTNLLVCSMGGKPLGEQDSLLHRSQRKFAKEALDNIRRSCTGYSRVIPTLDPKFFLETIELLQKHCIDEPRIELIRRQMIGAQEEELFPCECCSLRLSTLLILPCCGGLACPECLDGSNQCTLCAALFDVNDFQTLQPGYNLTWHSNLDDDVIAGGISRYTAEKSYGESPRGNRANEHGLNLGTDYAVPLLRPPQDVRPVRKFGDHDCQFDRFAGDGRCILCRQEHDACVLVNEKRRCPTCHRVSIPCPPEESKAFHLIQTMRRLHSESVRLCYKEELKYSVPRSARPFKSIIFSQFRGVLNVIGSRLIWEFGSACVAEFWGKSRQSELVKFISDSNCFCMLLGKDGSEGLDLSFVTHIFFLEEILDKSLMDQAVARAWRMGARGRVEVETIIAKNTVEEIMDDMDKRKQRTSSRQPGDGNAQIDSKPDQLSKTHFLLRSLRLLTDFHSLTSTGCSAQPPKKRLHTATANSQSVTMPEGAGESRKKRVRFNESSVETNR